MGETGRRGQGGSRGSCGRVNDRTVVTAPCITLPPLLCGCRWRALGLVTPSVEAFCPAPNSLSYTTLGPVGSWGVCMVDGDWLGKGEDGKSCLRAVRPQEQRSTPRPVCTPLHLGAPGSPCQGCRRTDPGSHARPTARWTCPGRTGRT